MISQFCFCIAVCDIFTQNMNCERFFIISTFSKAIETFQIALFEKNFTNEKFSFLFVFYTRNRHSTMIENYIKRNDVIWCKLNRLIFIEIESKLHFWNLLYRRRNFFLIRSVYAKTTLSVDRKLYKKRYCILMRTWLFNFHRSLSRNVLSRRDKIVMSQLFNF